MFEKYTNSRFFLITEQISKIDKCLLSRCFTIRLSVPNKLQIKNYVKNISEKYSLELNNDSHFYKINNLFLLNNILINYIHNKKFNYQNIIKLEQSIEKIIVLINKKNIDSILEIRTICYNLLLLNLGVDYVFKKLINYYLSSELSNSIKMKILEASSSINNNLGKIEHNLISLEYFILKVKKILL